MNHMTVRRTILFASRFTRNHLNAIPRVFRDSSWEVGIILHHIGMKLHIIIKCTV
jgi:hypothetical protein